MHEVPPFKPLSSSFEYIDLGLRLGVALYCDDNEPICSLADIVANCPIRLLADTEFVFLSRYDTTRKSQLSHLLRYRDQSMEATTADVTAQIISRLDCLATNSFMHARIALLLGIPVWYFALEGCRGHGDAHKLKSLWGEKVTVVSGRSDISLGVLFRRMFLFRLLNPGSTLFETFSGDFSIGTTDGPITFSSPLIRTPEDIDLLLRSPLVKNFNVTIETTSICNLSCSYCPNSKYERDKSFMQESLFYQIIDSLLAFDPNYSGKISPHLYGEPLLDERLEEFILYCKEKFPKASVELFTNGCFLNLDRYLSLKQAGVDIFRISQHEPTPPPTLMETLSRIQADYPELYTVAYNVEYLSEYKMNRGGLIDVATLPLPDKHFARCVTYRDLTIDVHGNVILCCNDYFGKHVFGNLNDNSVQYIWESPDYCEIRNQLFFGLLPLSICQSCLDIVKT